jgi:hypothetical protein
MIKLILAITLCASTPTYAYNWVALGTTQTCADLNDKRYGAGFVAQWVFGYVTGVDATIRPGKSRPAHIDAQRMADDILKMCKLDPQARQPRASLATISPSMMADLVGSSRLNLDPLRQ